MTEDPIDMSALLAPLQVGEQGAGEDLRSDFAPTSPYQRLRDARASARADERARDSQGDTEGPQAEGWRQVLAIGQAVLTTKSKDFEVAAWFTEALVRLHGLPGLTSGAKMLTGLCERYWEAGFPQADDEGLEARLSPIGGLSGREVDGTLMQPLRRLPLFRRIDGTGIALYQWDQAEEVSALNEERREARYAAGVPELSKLEAEGRADKAHLSGIGREAQQALDAWRALDQALTGRVAAESPSMRKVTNVLERIVEVVVKLGAQLDDAESPRGDEPNAVPSVGGQAAGAKSGALGPAGALRSRDDALRELDRIAEFFRRTEPHSPLAYTLEEAVRRGRMTLTELLMEVLPEPEARNAMLGRLGMRTDSTS